MKRVVLQPEILNFELDEITESDIDSSPWKGGEQVLIMERSLHRNSWVARARDS